MMRYDAILLVSALSAVMLPNTASGQVRRFDLTTTQVLSLHNATAEAVTFKGKRSVRVTISPDAARRPEYASGQAEPEVQAWIAGVEFTNGVIEADRGLAGGRRWYRSPGFVGIAFRLQTDRSADAPQAYDAFYLRPTNGRADDQERRNHSVQYISHPDWTWSRLRRETPSRYESYVDVVPDTWTKIRIEARIATSRA